MRSRILITIVFYCLIWTTVLSQESPYLPDSIVHDNKYVFYLHGGIVQEMGAYAVSDQFGPYEYFTILDALRSFGFVVISEVRPKATVEAQYAMTMRLQVDSLLARGVPERNIIIVGASLGAYIAMELAILCKRPGIKYALLGLCSDYALQHFKKYRGQLCGNFLSIYETSDQKRSCLPLFDGRSCLQTDEIALSMNNGHGFIYKPHPEWMQPLKDWILIP